MLKRFAFCFITSVIGLASLSGCGALVRSSVDTQPRVSLAAADFDDPARIVRGEPIAYLPPSVESAGDIDADLTRFAPIIVQGFQADATHSKYDRDDDAIGSPTLAREGDAVRVDASAPAMFCRVEHAMIGKQSFKQLTYVFWYPRRPVGSIDKGDVDGGILRVTLDAAGHPAVFEYSQPCGCFHGVFVSDAFEQAVAREFGNLLPNRMHSSEAPLNGDGDWIVRDVVHLAAAPASDARPTLYMSAGKHFCEAVRFESRDALHQVAGERTYDLRPYESLQSIPRDGGGTGSMFNERGLVHGGKRKGEEFLLSDLDNPGWPRHLDHMKIDWDRAQWNDPTLIEKHLRVPSAMLNAEDTSASLADTATSTSSIAADAGLPRIIADAGTRGTLLLFTNRACLGCMAMKRDVLPDVRVQRVMNRWTVRTLDTATPEGAMLAAAHHVSVTPTLVALDINGHERTRSEDVLSVEEMLAAILRSDS